jgi:hypothetical protein
MERWRPLLEEVRRVLLPGGRVEIIDDELIFPTIQRPSSPRRRGGSLRMKSTSKFDGDSEDDQLSKPSLKRSPTYSGRRTYSSSRSTTANSIDKDFSTRATVAENMETIFDKMLRHRYNICSRPHELLAKLMGEIFGNGRSNCMYTANISIPKCDPICDKSPSKSGAGQSKFLGLSSNLGKGRRPSLDNEASRQGGLSTPKAVQILGEEAATEAGASASGYQPRGFIVSPNIFIPCDPGTLEWHACRSMHIVMSCKQAIYAYIQEFQDDNGRPLVSYEEFDQFVQTYDR